MTKKLILVSNDDGYNSDGIRALAEAVSDYANVVVVAPATDQSAVSHAMTLFRPLRLKEHKNISQNSNISF